MYSERIFRLFDVLDGTFVAFYKVNYVPGATISRRLYSKHFPSGSAVKHGASSNKRTCFAASLFTLAIPLVALPGFFQCSTYKEISKVARTAGSNQGRFRERTFHLGGSLKYTVMATKNV